MPDPARVAQAEALEVPVVVQGTTTDAATGRRDLFSEAAQTILVFPDGAVLNLRAKVSVGQMVFLRNEQSGREILCKVVEAPSEGQPGHTELEFTAFDPEFWEGGASPREAAAPGAVAATIMEDAEPAARVQSLEAAAEPEPELPPAFDMPAEISHATVSAVDAEAAERTPGFEVAAKPEAPAEMEAPAENSLAMMGENASEVKLPPARVPGFDPPAPSPSTGEERKRPPREEIVAAHEVVVPQGEQEAAPQTLPAPSTPTGEQIDAALRAMSPKDAQDEQSHAALTRRQARLAAYATLKEKAAAAAASASEIAGKALELGHADAEGGTEMEDAPEPPLLERLTTGKNLVISEIVLCVAIFIALGFVWHAVRGLFFHPSYGPASAAAAAPPKPHAAAAPGPKAAPVVSGAATVPVAPVAAANARGPAKEWPALVRTPATPIGKVAAPMRAPVAGAAGAKRGGEIARHLDAETDDADSGPRVVDPPPPVLELEPTEAVAPKAFENVPASIVEASQPPLPPWAKALGLDGVVRLDAVIDEKGNLAGAKVLSGPEALRRSAVNAVQIWLFAAAKVNGKPTTTHMILTVQFQR